MSTHTTNAIVQTAKLVTLGDAIRAKAGLSDEMTLDEMATAVANIETGGTYQSKSVTPTTSSQTVTPDSGYDALSSVTVSAMPSGSAGTPSATKGTVSNHAVSVTPSVTNTTGYITGGTINGTSVSVSASELVSGTLSITSSGTKDVTNYASASVASGSASTPATSITANPTISVSASGLITASVSGSQSVTPSVSAGYVASGTAGTVSVSGSATQQLTVYNGAHHSVSLGSSVTVSLTNPSGTANFGSVTIESADSSWNPIELLGTITSPTGSATVTVPSSAYGIIVSCTGSWVGVAINYATKSCTGGVSFDSNDGYGASRFVVTADGTVTIDGIDWEFDY